MNYTLKANQIQKEGITWEVREEGNDIILDSVATDTMRVIYNGYEMLLDEVTENLPAGHRHNTSIQKIREIANEELVNFAIDNFDRSVIVQP